MTTPPLEDRLTLFADGMSAPPTADARAAIGRRSAVLRRRRRARRAAGAGIVALAAAVGSVIVTRDVAPEAHTDVSDTGDDGPPAFTLELDGWDVVQAEDTVPESSGPPGGHSVQVFRRPGVTGGPQVVLRHSSASDALVPIDDLDEPVSVGTVTGYLRRVGSDELTLRWAPPIGDNVADIEATGLAREDVLAFAEGLEPKDDTVIFPGTDDRFGFVAHTLPQGLTEVPPPEEPVDDTAARRLVAESADATLELTVEPATGVNAAAIEAATHAGDDEEVTVMGHPAMLIDRPGWGVWSLIWEPRPDSIARMVLAGVERAEVDAVIGGLRELTSDEWRALVNTTSG